MNARSLLESLGSKLVGRKVMTEPYGEWPGGPAKVIQIEPDPNSPEIVFQVRHETVSEIGVDERWEIGVLEHEDVMLL